MTSTVQGSGYCLPYYNARSWSMRLICALIISSPSLERLCKSSPDRYESLIPNVLSEEPRLCSGLRGNIGWLEQLMSRGLKAQRQLNVNNWGIATHCGSRISGDLGDDAAPWTLAHESDEGWGL
ncbi:hypothetical protein J6590_057738 [Homalodisca vitripennis]|nr:hypothetical protein J6590_057738 [Homalodisca vitripennis]